MVDLQASTTAMRSRVIASVLLLLVVISSPVALAQPDTAPMAAPGPSGADEMIPMPSDVDESTAPSTTDPELQPDDIDPCRMMSDAPEGCEPIVCPENACFIEGNVCLDTVNDCLCNKGYVLRGDVCVPSDGYCLQMQYYPDDDDCEPMLCPVGSCIDPEEACVDGPEKCMCQGGYMMMPEDGSCVDTDGEAAEMTPVCMDSYELVEESGLCEPASGADADDEPAAAGGDDSAAEAPGPGAGGDEEGPGAGGGE